MVGLVLLRRRRRSRASPSTRASGGARTRGSPRARSASGCPARASCSPSRAPAPGEPIAARPASFRVPRCRSSLWEIRFEGAGRLFERAEHLATDRERYRDGRRRRRRCASPPGATRCRSVRPRRGGRDRPLRAARLGRGHARGGRAPPSARGPGHARPLLGRARLAAGALLALVRDGRRPGQLPRAQQRRAARRRRDGGRLPDARRRDRADRRRARPSPSSTRSSAASAPSSRARPTRWARDDSQGRALEVAPLRQRRDGRLTHVNEALTEYDWEGRARHGHLRVPRRKCRPTASRRVAEARCRERDRRRTRTSTRRPAELLRNLIRFDTTNPPGNERECIAYIEGLLGAAGIETDDPRARPRAAEPGRAPARPRRGSAAAALRARRRGHTEGQTLDASALRGRRGRRLHLGPRRGRHEGRRRDDAVGVPARARPRGSSPPAT